MSATPRLGLMLPLDEITFDQGIDVAHIAHDAGFDGIWVRDTPMRGSQLPDRGTCWDPLTQLAFIAGSAVPLKELGTAVMCAGFRPWQTLARQAVSVAHFSDNRLILGMGKGMQSDVNQEYGVSPGKITSVLRESIEKSHAVMTGTPGVLPESLLFDLPETFSPPPIHVATTNVAFLEHVHRSIGGWFAPLLSPTELARRRSTVEEHAPGLECSMLLPVELDPRDHDAATIVHAGGPTRIRAGRRALTTITTNYLDIGVDRLLLTITGTHQPWKDLAPIAESVHESIFAKAGQLTCI